MANFYIELGQNGYGYDQVHGYKIRDLLSDLGVYYDPAENDPELLNAEIFARDFGNRHGANYYGVAGAFEIDREEEDD
ncbi:hypothetical protein FACS1894217_08880 [Clostridia bacterium]|nr:hypothetical protein FACS1894202_09200 [Clostridia bacterium]GHV07666.1 hypothetical protein FACS1894217_08880 [Clostridia bacterium]